MGPRGEPDRSFRFGFSITLEEGDRFMTNPYPSYLCQQERKDPTMRPDRTLFLIPFFLFLLSCSGNDAEGERIEKEAERSAEKAADRSFDKLNQGGSDSAKTDSSAD